MDSATWAAFVDHVHKLERLALSCPDEDRRIDAVRSLAAMTLLIEGDEPDPPDEAPADNVVKLEAYARKRAA